MGPLALIPKASGQARPPPGQGQGHPFQTFISRWCRARPICALAHTWSHFPDQGVETQKTLLMAPGHREQAPMGLGDP